MDDKLSGIDVGTIDKHDQDYLEIKEYILRIRKQGIKDNKIKNNYF